MLGRFEQCRRAFPIKRLHAWEGIQGHFIFAGLLRIQRNGTYKQQEKACLG